MGMPPYDPTTQSVLDVRKSDRVIVDVNQHYDERFFDLIVVAKASVPPDIIRRNYVRDPDGTIRAKNIPTIAATNRELVLIGIGESMGPLRRADRPIAFLVLVGSLEVRTPSEVTTTRIVLAGNSFDLAAGIEFEALGTADNTTFFIVRK